MIANSKKLTAKKVKNVILYQDNEITISKELNGQLSFEIGKTYTFDIPEAVAILMRNPKWAKLELWKIVVQIDEINPVHCLYWLSGGDNFWKHPERNLDWVDAYPSILRKFESKMEDLKKKKTMNDIRKFFKKHFNLDIFYEFALSKGMI